MALMRGLPGGLSGGSDGWLFARYSPLITPTTHAIPAASRDIEGQLVDGDSRAVPLGKSPDLDHVLLLDPETAPS
jgi:hypothetical protein